MSWAKNVWSRSPWASGEQYAAQPGQQTPPPIPGGTRTFAYSTAGQLLPWAAGGWAGGGLRATYPGGGLVLVPDPDRGLMRVLCWWPDTAAVQLLRVRGNGTIEPVRGAYPLTLGPTRRNYASNPGAEQGINGWTPGVGAPVVTRVSTLGEPGAARHNLVTKPSAEDASSVWGTFGAGTTITRIQPGAAPFGSWVMQAVCGTAAANFGGAHTITAGITPGEYYTLSAHVQPQVTRDVRLYVEWRDASNATIITNFGTTDDVPPGEWTRVQLNRVAPVGAARVVISAVAVAGGLAETLLIDAALLELSSAAAPAGSYFDGSTAGATWDGAVGASSSRLITVDTVPSGGYAVRLIATASGTSEVAVPIAAVSTGVAVTLAMDLQMSATPSGITATVTWFTSTGAAAGTTTASLTADQYVHSVGQWARQVVTVTAPAGAATASAAKLSVAGLPAGATVDVDTVVVESGATTGAPLDGDMLGGAWVGTPGLSASVLATVGEVADGECPLDTPVTYLLANPSITGGRITSAPAELPSHGRTWLTHPSASNTPRRVSVRAVPKLTRALDRGVFRPLRRRRAVIVTAAQRSAPSGTIGINALSAAEYEWLVDVLDDGQPILLRTPVNYHFTPQWISLGDQDDDREGRLGHQDAWLISAPFDEVDPPSALVS